MEWVLIAAGQNTKVRERFMPNFKRRKDSMHGNKKQNNKRYLYKNNACIF